MWLVHRKKSFNNVQDQLPRTNDEKTKGIQLYQRGLGNPKPGDAARSEVPQQLPEPPWNDAPHHQVELQPHPHLHQNSMIQFIYIIF